MCRTGRNVSTLAVALALGLASTPPTGAQPAAPPPQFHPGGERHGLAGAITAVAAGAIVISDRSGKAVTVKMTPTTRILKPTQGTLADLRSGEAVQVVAEPGQNGSLVARGIEINPMPAANGRGGWVRGGQTSVDGTVAQVSTSMLTVKRPDGSTVAVGITQTTRIGMLATLSPSALTVGTRVMVQGPPNPDGTVTATVVMVADFQRH